MFPLFESIRCYNGRIYNIEAHNHRVDRSRKVLLGIEEKVNLRSLISVPPDCRKGLYKCRISYGERFSHPVFTKYTPRKIRSLKAIEIDFDYPVKKEDRSMIDETYSRRGDCDDILMIRKDLITDTSYSNVALFDGSEWHTPRLPLLLGTKRAQLIRHNRIVEKDIRPSDLKSYQKIALINAMNPLSLISFDTSQIIF